jgi:broad specificity phosphatase PhoE
VADSPAELRTTPRADPSVMIFVRHGRAIAQPGLATEDWPLDPAHVGDIDRLRSALPEVPVICSDMRRAVETAAYFGEPTIDARLREVSRPWTDDVERALARYFEDAVLDGWEPQAEVRTRMQSVVDDYGAAIYVSHGTALSLYLASVAPALRAMAFWNRLRSPDAWALDGMRVTRVEADVT